MLSEKIKAAQKAIAAKKEELSTLVNQAANGEEVSAEVIEALTKSIEQDQAQMGSMERAEQVLMSKTAPAFVKNKAANEYSFAKSAIVAMKAKADGTSSLEAAAKLYGEDSGTFAVTKAATYADQDGAAWAGNLLRPAYAEFLEALRPVAVLPQIAAKGGRSLTFDTNQTLIVPFDASSGSQISGAFIGEGTSIPVKVGSIGQKTIKQAKLGVISVFTKEILERSTPSIEALVMDSIVRDTAAVLDAAFLSTAAATAVQPAGILNGVASTALSVVAPATTVTTTQVVAELKKALNSLSAKNMGQRLVCLLSPQVARSISLMLSQTGTFIFAAEIASGRLLGMDLIVSTAVNSDHIIIADAAQLAFGLGAPSFTVSDNATLDMDGGASHQATMSLFQNDMMAVRMMAKTAWSDLRTGSVEQITGAALI